MQDTSLNVRRCSRPVNREELGSIVTSRCRLLTFPAEPLASAEWQALEARFGCQLPPELYEIRVLLARYAIEGDHLPVAEILHDYDWELRHNPNWSEDFIPFCAVGNGDYLCVRRSEGAQSGVYYVAHDDPDTQRLHASVADYIRDSDWFP
jgi:hypothetical protein